MALKLPNPLINFRVTTTKNTTKSSTITYSCNNPPLRIAYQGSPGAYSEYAAKLSCSSCKTIPCPTFPSTISALNLDLADRAILPVETTATGSTELRNYNLLLQNDLHIVQELNLFIHYCLLVVPGVRKSEIRKVVSHPMALAECGRAIKRMGIDGEAVEDTAGAVEMLRSTGLLDTAAIASARAGIIYGLDVIDHGIQDENWNVTRFLLVSKSPTKISPDEGMLKTSMVVASRGGSMTVLLKVLKAFSSRKINLSKLEVNNPAMEGGGEKSVMVMDVQRQRILRSFPHVLYVDFEGSVHEENVKEAIEEIKEFSVFVRILGCYAADHNVYDLH